jgi:nucleoside triphosphatase
MLLCIECKGNKVEEVVDHNRRYFHCSTCKKLHERAIDSRFGKDVAINTDNGTYHLSAGALIRKGNKFLLLKRRSFPFGFDFPAGHVEYNETPLDAVKREVMEETGLKITDTDLIFEGEMRGNKCKYGADNHVWFFYNCNYEPGVPFLNSESESLGWYSKEEAEKLDLVASAKFLLTRIENI